MSGGGGSNTDTVVQQAQPNPVFQQAYSNVVGQAQNLGNVPLQNYPGQIVAGLSPDQQAGITATQNAYGAASPYINAAGQAIGQAMTPLAPSLQPYANQAQGYFQQAGQELTPSQFSPGAVQQYESPYTQQVVNATEAQFNNQNQQQQQGVVGNAISAGAWGGDRSAVAQGILAGQQQLAEAPVIAGLENQGYAQALQEFNQQQGVNLGAQQASQQLQMGAGQGIMGIGGQELGANEANAWLASQAGFGLGNLGQEALSTGLTGANALLGVGGLEQGQAQSELNVPYAQFLAQQAYPFQVTGWESNIAQGLGSAAGGTSTTTSPGPSPLSQGLGVVSAGIGAAGLANSLGAFGGSGGGAAALAGGGAGGIGAAATDAAITDAAVSAAGEEIGAAGAIGGAALAARGGAIPHRAPGGGIVAFPSHRARMPGTGMGITANDNHMFNPTAARGIGIGGAHIQHLAAGGIAIPQLPMGGYGDLAGMPPAMGAAVTGTAPINNAIPMPTPIAPPEPSQGIGGLSGNYASLGANPSLQAYLNATQAGGYIAPPSLSPVALANKYAPPPPPGDQNPPNPIFADSAIVAPVFNGGDGGGSGEGGGDTGGGMRRGGWVHRADGGPSDDDTSDVAIYGADQQGIAGGMPDDVRQRIIQRESGGQNIYNYKHAADPTGFTASGLYQDIKPTWQEGAKLAGADIGQYPEAINAPPEVQHKVNDALYDKYGEKPWAASGGQKVASNDGGIGAANMAGSDAMAGGPGIGPSRQPTSRPSAADSITSPGGEPSPWKALLYAGLGMMGGTSPHAAVNIGRGALAGAKQYESEDETAKKLMLGAEEAKARLKDTETWQQGQLDVRQQNADTAGRRADTGAQRAQTYQSIADANAHFKQLGYDEKSSNDLARQAIAQQNANTAAAREQVGADYTQWRQTHGDAQQSEVERWHDALRDKGYTDQQIKLLEMQKNSITGALPPNAAGNLPTLRRAVQPPGTTPQQSPMPAQTGSPNTAPAPRPAQQPSPFPPGSPHSFRLPTPADQSAAAAALKQGATRDQIIEYGLKNGVDYRHWQPDAAP
jgi:hypothetical protein